MKSRRKSIGAAAKGRVRRKRGIRLAAKAAKPARGTLQQRVYHALARGLMGGMFTPGEAVSLRTLAVIIPRLSRERFIELSRARQRLEGMLAEMGCANARKVDIDALVRINEDLRQAIAAADTRTAMIGNMEFHFAFYALARSQVVLPLIETLWRQAGPFVALSAKMPNVRWTQRHHGRLLAALRAGEARAARQAIEDDIEETLQELLKKADFEDGRRA
jgi:DNA-binding GntR family transcriptional regulator